MNAVTYDLKYELSVTTCVDSILHKIETRLGEKLTDYFPNLNGGACSVECVKLRRFAYSTVYFFRINSKCNVSETSGIVVKIFAKQFGRHDIPGAQYSALCSVWPVFKNSFAFGLPRPLDFIPELPALVMEQVQGVPLQKMFWTIGLIPGRFGEVVQACHQSGKWLKHFHRGTDTTPRPLDLLQKRDGAIENFVSLERFGFSKALLRRVRASIDDKAHRLAGVEMPTALVHGDFTVDNILVNKERYFAIDLTGRDINAVFHDLASFLNSLNLMRLSLPLPASKTRRCGEAFLTGYFGVESFNRMAVDFLILTGRVSVALEILSRRGDRIIARWWMRQFFERIIGECLDERKAVNEVANAEL